MFFSCPAKKKKKKGLNPKIVESYSFVLPILAFVIVYIPTEVRKYLPRDSVCQ